MKYIYSVPIEDLQRHLATTRSAVSLPWNADDYDVFSVCLEARDLDRIFLWWEFRKYTNGTCKLENIWPSCRDYHPRVKQFAGVDLTKTDGLEIVAVTNELDGPLYIIDGNHRLISQHLTRGIEGVPAFVCVHPEMSEWEYVPLSES